MDLWAYKFDVKGHTFWFCRYNCHRAGEKKHEAQIAKNRSKAGRKIPLKSKKPSKEILESALRAGLTILIIAKNYDSSCASVRNWIKSYGLAGIQGVKKPDQESTPLSGRSRNPMTSGVAVADHGEHPVIHHAPPVADIVQEPPLLSEIDIVIAKDRKFYDDLKTGYAEEIVQHSPTLAEIEQFHTGNPVQELPKVEMDPIRGIYPTLGIEIGRAHV